MKRGNDGRSSSYLTPGNAASRKPYFPNKSTNSPVKFRRKISHIFQLCYADLCSMYNIPMIFPIKAHLHKRVLDFMADRVKIDEWRPILKALSVDRSLHLIAIRSKTSFSKVLEHIDSETKSRNVVKLPVLLTNFIFRRVVMSLSRCLSYNTHLKCLELDGLLLSGEYLESLLAGLERSSSLQHLSLHRCPLGDDGCQMVCNSLRNIPNIITLDISGCNISDKGAQYVARTLQYQNLNRYGENWKQSLRSRTPDTEIMPGLRRVTLNHNPLIGDTGVGHILGVLKDDLWLKALDLQNVGLTNVGGLDIVDLLGVNKSLSVLDVHNNPELDKSIFESVMNLLASNNLGKTSEYHWIPEDTLCLPLKPLHQRRDPSFVQRTLKSHNEKDLESRHHVNDLRPVRLTKSSIIPSAKSAPPQIMKTRSASAVISGDHEIVDQKTPAKTIPNNPFKAKVKTIPNTSNVHRWEHFNASGDGCHTNDIRAKLRELSSKLEEETYKRLEAEKQKADLELRLEKLARERQGKILMEPNLVKELTEAFAVFNCFLAIFSKGGLALETAHSSEEFSGSNLSDVMSNNSFPQKSQCGFESGVDDELDDANHLTFPVSSTNVKEKAELEEAFVSNVSPNTPCPKVDQQPNHPQKETAYDFRSAENVGNYTTFCGETKELPESTFQKVLHEILLWDDLKTNPLSFITNRQSDIPVRMNSAFNTPRKKESDNGSLKSGKVCFHKGSNESLYMNAEQDDENFVDDSNSSWVTDSFECSDSSPTPTLTELNVN